MIFRSALYIVVAIVFTTYVVGSVAQEVDWGNLTAAQLSTLPPSAFNTTTDNISTIPADVRRFPASVLPWH